MKLVKRFLGTGSCSRPYSGSFVLLKYSRNYLVLFAVAVHFTNVSPKRIKIALIKLRSTRTHFPPGIVLDRVKYYILVVKRFWIYTPLTFIKKKYGLNWL